MVNPTFEDEFIPYFHYWITSDCDDISVMRDKIENEL